MSEHIHDWKPVGSHFLSVARDEESQRDRREWKRMKLPNFFYKMILPGMLVLIVVLFPFEYANTQLPTGTYVGTINNVQINHVQFTSDGRNYTLDFSGVFVSCYATFKIGSAIQVNVESEPIFWFWHYAVINGTQLGASGWPNSNAPTCDLTMYNGFRST